jgi:hypothetical protein
LLARIQQKQGNKIPESFMCILGDSISAETIEKLRIAAHDGARIYLEGSPKVEGDVARWNDLVGASADSTAKKKTTMLLSDPWLFGTATGSKIEVEQAVQIGKLNLPKPLPKKDQPEKGKDILTEPRVVATLADGSLALIENPIGDGSIFWNPNRLLGPFVSNNREKQQEFYSSIAARLGTGLIKIAANNKVEVPLHAAIRRSPKGTELIGLFNDSHEAAQITLEANQFAGVALDLKEEKELPLRTRGNRSFIDTTVPAEGWQIIALGATRHDLDEERFAPRAKAKLK